MPSLKDLKTRIKSVKSTQKITKAMKMVAAAKLRRAREAAEGAQPYVAAMERMVARLAAAQGETPGTGSPVLLSGTGRDQQVLLIVVTADRGLCGAFNSSVVRAARRMIRELEAQGKQVRLYALGRKGRDWLNEYAARLIGQRIHIAKDLNYGVAESVSGEILSAIERGEVDRVVMVYNHFKSVMSQVVTVQQLMPLSVADATPAAGAAAQASDAYEFEPSEEEILADLLPRNFAMQIYRALLDNNAGFFGAQMRAMENATKNAGEMIKKLTLKYNRTRQANITRELIEIISGAEAI